jgi:hypothetical protein
VGTGQAVLRPRRHMRVCASCLIGVCLAVWLAHGSPRVSRARIRLVGGWRSCEKRRVVLNYGQVHILN